MLSADNHTVSTFSPREASTRDVTHSFLNFTFTRALCKNVAKKMRKLNDDLANIMNMGDSAESYDLYFHKYICEVCLSVEPCDFVFQASAFHTILNCFSSSQQKSKSVDNGPELILLEIIWMSCGISFWHVISIPKYGPSFHLLLK
jgi:hypothetical protein